MNGLVRSWGHILYGTAKPTREMVEDSFEFAAEIERLHCTYTVLWKDDAPDEILFFGYPAD